MAEPKKIIEWCKHVSRLDLTLNKAIALMVVRGHPDGIKTGDLAREVGFSTAACTGLVDGLEKRGFVERCPVPGDRRVRRIFLTEECEKQFPWPDGRKRDGRKEASKP